MSLASLLSDIAKNWVKATQEQFTNHPVASLVRNQLVTEIEAVVNPLHPDFIVRASPGAGNWAAVPWVAILNPAITNTTQRGVYPVFLFRADGSGIYLSLGFGTTNLRDEFGISGAQEQALKIKKTLRFKDNRLDEWDSEIDLRARTALGRSYEWASAGAKFYAIEQMPDDQTIKKDLIEILNIYAEAVELLGDKPKFNASTQLTLSKPFLLLAGISGTGKSRFVRQQAAAQGNEQQFFQLVPVRPDWHEPSDLLGYISRINGEPKFVVTDVLRFVVKAWKASGAQAMLLPNGKTGWWSNTPLDTINTYWLCLDEMNLAPVEQYFADYLSVIESRQWLDGQELADTGKDYVYHCLPILPASSLNAVADQSVLATDLGLDIENNQTDQLLWANFVQHGIPVPLNLVVAGTVNMDETTHGFSRKVIDRALTIDFGRFFPNDFNQLWAPETKPKTLSFSRLSHASKESLANCPADVDGQKTIQFLKDVNKTLTDTPFELAYRALNELLLAVVCHNPQTETELQAVWDDFLMCKVLPRIEGDDEKLSVNLPNSGDTLLDMLSQQLAASMDQIWLTQRPDLLRENLAADTPLTVACRSKAKIEWMKNRLERNSFTSFWP